MFEWLITKSPLLYLTQSLWRDEAFSVLMAENSPWQIIKLTAHDFNPPLYYLTLHYWMEVFGSSEISIRMLSFIFHLILVYIVYKFSKKSIFSEVEPLRGSTSLSTSLLITFLIAFNPMLLYYAFEARMYSLLALLALLSMYHFINKNWRWYIFFTTAGLYTQPFMIFVVLSQMVYLLFIDKKRQMPKFVKIGLVFLLYTPWIRVIFNQFKQAGPMWIYPVDFNLITSVLGNLYLGYEGTPGWLWPLTKIISLIIIAFIMLPLIKRRVKKEAKLFYLWLFLPLTLVIGFSFLKPIFVNRYLIYTTIPLTFLVVLGINTIRQKAISLFSLICFLLSVFWFNFWYSSYHQKTDFRLTLLRISQNLSKDDMIVSQTPLSFFEVNYYDAKKTRGEKRVFLYNPANKPVPAYLGTVLIPQERWLVNFPSGRQIFLIHDDGTYSKIKS